MIRDLIKERERERERERGWLNERGDRARHDAIMAQTHCFISGEQRESGIMDK